MNLSKLRLLSALIALATLSLPLPAQDYADQPIAVLITESSLAGFAKGKVLGYFPQAVLSRDPLRRTKGYFIFDLPHLEETQIPLQIKYEPATKKQDEATKEWKVVTPEKLEYSVLTEQFLTKLNSLMVEKKSTEVAAGFLPSSPFTGLKDMGKDSYQFRYFLKAGSTTSYLVELGDRAKIEALHKAVSAEDAAANSARYLRHFATRNLQIKLFKLRSGEKPANPRLIQGVTLSRHISNEMPDGKLIVNYGAEVAPWTSPTVSLTYTAEKVNFEVLAAPFLETIIAPLLTEKGKAPVKLECVIGEEEGETACKKNKTGGNSIKGVLDATTSLNLIVEKAGVGGDDYRDLYRIELLVTK